MYKLLFLILLLSTTQAISQMVRHENEYGKNLYYVDKNTIKISGKHYQYGRAIFYFDGSTIYRAHPNQPQRPADKYGEKIIYIDGNVIRESDKHGKRLYFFDGNVIRESDKHGRILYHISNNTIQKERWGRKIFYYDGILEKWIIICLITLNK